MLGCAGSFVLNVRLPLKGVSAFGVNVTFTVRVPVPGTVNGPAGLNVKRASELARLEIVSGFPPVFWIMTGNIVGVPTRTGPKFRAVGTTTTCGAVTVLMATVEIEAIPALAVPSTVGGVDARSTSLTCAPRMSPQTPIVPSIAVVAPPDSAGLNEVTIGPGK